jgi:hypothetical protein
MKAEGIESIFLASANTSLKDNPEILYKIIDGYIIHFSNSKIPLEYQAGLLRSFVDHFTEIVKYDDLQKAKEFYKQKEEFYKKAKIDVKWWCNIRKKLFEDSQSGEDPKKAFLEADEAFCRNKENLKKKKLVKAYFDKGFFNSV